MKLGRVTGTVVSTVKYEKYRGMKLLRVQPLRLDLQSDGEELVALDAANAVYMVGDYTDVDPAITAYLQRHKAVGVPLYVVYPRGGGEGRILPVILTPGIVEDALREAAR